MDENTSSSSEDDVSSSECDSDSSSYVRPENFEDVKIFGIKLQLPQGMCENKNIFRELFSVRTWNNLPELEKQHLKNFLPCFPDNDNVEKNITLQKLFTGEKIGFQNPLDEFFKHLKSGNYHPEISRLRHRIRRAQRRESKTQQRRRLNGLVRDVLASRQWLLNTAGTMPPGILQSTRCTPSVQTTSRDPVFDIAQRAKKRYFHELAAVRSEVGEGDIWSEDENYPEGPDLIHNSSKSKHKRISATSPISGSAPLSPGAERSVISSLSTRDGIKPRANLSEVHLNEDTYRTMLARHKRKRNEHEDRIELNTSGINLADVASRTLLTASNKKTILNLHRSANTLLIDQKPVIKRTVKKEREIAPKRLSNCDIRLNNNPYAILRNMSGHSSNSELDASDSESTVEPTIDEPSTAVRPLTKSPIKMQRMPQRISNPAMSSSPVDINSMRTGVLDGETIETVVFESERVDQTRSPKLDEPRQRPGTFEVANVSRYGGKATPATLSDLEGIDMLDIPVDFDDSDVGGTLDDVSRGTPELMQETHASFLSLVRDIICSTSEHRMSFGALENRLRTWQANPISPLNDWYSLVDDWVDALPCAVGFLRGDFAEQPDDFVPYVELKTAAREYQWIGAGRDSDGLLAPLFRYWLDHRGEMAASKDGTRDVDTETTDPSKSPPPPRWPTGWVVRKAEPDEIERFREQERRRYENPHKAFTYKMNGYESVVGPVKGIYNQTAGMAKARGHSMLNSNRPNFVTILTLVRDATARLPNGEGTRADICELLKSSQYISHGASDSVLQSVVSGALDRMHTEYDPCVKYDTKRKIWIYLHRNRTEAEFEKIHQRQQGMSRHQKKNNSRKNKVKAKPTTEKAVLVPLSKQKRPEDINNDTVATSTTVTTPDVTTNKRFRAPASRATTVTTVAIASPPVTTTPIEPNRTPAGTSLLINQKNKQSTAIKPSTEKAHVVTSNVKILACSTTGQTIERMTDSIIGKSSPTMTATVQTLQSVVAPRTNGSASNSPITKAVAAGKGVVKIVNSSQNAKSLVDATTLLANRHGGNTIFVKQQPSTTGRPSVSTPVVGVKPVQRDTTGLLTQLAQQSKQTTVVMSQANTIVHSLVQPRQPVVTRQIVQAVTGQKPQQSVLTHQQAGTIPQQIIQTIATQQLQAQKILPGVTIAHQKQPGTKTATITALTPAQQQLLQNFKQQQARASPTQQAATTAQQQALLKQQVALQQFQKQLQQQTVAVATSGKSTSTSLLDNQQTGQQRLQVTTTKPLGTTTATVQTPLVAKVLTNAAGQVISVESLLAHQKQHGSLPQGTTLRVAGGKLSQATNLIQLSGGVSNQVAQFAVVSQGNIVSMAAGTQPQRVIATVAQTGNAQILVAAPPKTIPVTKNNVGQQSPQRATIQAGGKFQVQSSTNKIAHQLINAKIITTQNLANAKLVTTTQSSKQTTQKVTNAITSPKVIPVSTTTNKGATVAPAIRMVNSATGINFAHLAGKPILLASKGNTIQAQNIILRGQSTAGAQPGSSLVIASTNQPRQQNDGQQQIVIGAPLKLQSVGPGVVDASRQQKPQTGQLVAQQILLPQGFQAGAINIKTLQGLKVIPLAAAQQQTKGVATGRQQVFTRLVNSVTVSSADTVSVSSPVNRQPGNTTCDPTTER